MAPVETQEPAPSMLNRVDRLDIVLGYLVEKRSARSSMRSPATSTNSSGQLTGSDIYAGGDSSVTSSPKTCPSGDSGRLRRP
jgi:hypothetical protein